jgi:hypothetical protein
MNNPISMQDSTSNQTLVFEPYPKMAAKNDILHQRTLCLLHLVLSQYND